MAAMDGLGKELMAKRILNDLFNGHRRCYAVWLYVHFLQSTPPLHPCHSILCGRVPAHLLFRYSLSVWELVPRHTSFTPPGTRATCSESIEDEGNAQTILFTVHDTLVCIP